MTRRPHDAHYVCVCVCLRVVSPAPFVSCGFSQARAMLVGVGLCSATSRQVSPGMRVSYPRLQ